MVDMQITYTLMNGMGVKSDKTTGKAIRDLTADEMVAVLTTHDRHGRDIARYTVVGTNGNRIPAPWFLEGDR
jgi:hypothetical protein